MQFISYLNQTKGCKSVDKIIACHSKMKTYIHLLCSVYNIPTLLKHHYLMSSSNIFRS